MRGVEDKIAEWAAHKGILSNATLKDQLTKMVEELGEIAECIAKNDKGHLQEEIGDLGVTAIILAELAGHRFEDCLLLAYEKINGREGKMVDGVFVKEGDWL